MTLPEHVICSVLLAQFGVRQRYGWRAVVAVALAGVAPDIDTAAKLVSDREYWRLHHALGHGLLSVVVLSTLVAVVAGLLVSVRPLWALWPWCFLAAIVHVFTDAIYWWGVQLFWPFGGWELCLRWIEYLDLWVLALWLGGALCLYAFPARAITVSATTLGVFAIYLAARALLPQPRPGSWFHFIAGGWMYAAPHGTPVLDWW